eukprot:11114904-Lingulodinium_polyedra.AAC.1
MIEFVSSTCAIVGVLLGYSTGFGKGSSPICNSRIQQAAWEIDWNLVPPLCRADDIERKNEELRTKRQKKAEAATNSGAASSS